MREIRILRRKVDPPVNAELHEDMSVKDLFLAERSWTEDRNRILAELLRRSIPRSRWPQSLHWNWWTKARELKLLGTRQFGIFCEGRWQALMMTKTVPNTARLMPDVGRPLVYVDFLETAPWNWKHADIEQERHFLALGPALLKVAVEQSMQEEFRGRVGLHALEQSEDFYETIGMTRMASDPQKEGLVYFEFTRENAEQFVTKGKRP